MQKIALWYCLGAFALFALVAGCGGGSSTTVGGNTVTLTMTDLTGTAMDPAFLAFQDGSSAWQKVELNGSGHYTFTLTNPEKKYGVAIVDKAQDQWSNVLYATTRELSNIPYTIATPPSTSQYYTISGNLQGAGTSFVEVTSGWSSVDVDSASTSTYTMNNALAGNHLLMATSRTAELATPSKMWIKDITLNGNLTQDINFDDTTYGFTLGSKNVTLPADCSGEVDLWARRDATEWVYLGGTDESSSFSYATLPSGRMPNRALYDLYIDNDYASYDSYFSNPKDINAAGMTFPTVGNTTVNDTHTTVSWETCSEANLYDLWISNSGHYLWVLASKNWLGSTPSISMPNLSGLDGWNTRWMPSTMANRSVSAVIPSCSLSDYVGQEIAGQYRDGFSIKYIYYDNSSSLGSMNKKNGEPALRAHRRHGVRQ